LKSAQLRRARLALSAVSEPLLINDLKNFPAPTETAASQSPQLRHIGLWSHGRTQSKANRKKQRNFTVVRFIDCNELASRILNGKVQRRRFLFLFRP